MTIELLAPPGYEELYIFLGDLTKVTDSGHLSRENAKALLRFTQYIHQVHRKTREAQWKNKFTSQDKNRNMEMTQDLVVWWF